MKILRGVISVIMLAALGLSLAAAQKANTPNLGRSVHGEVLDGLDRPMPGAIVYMKNVRSKDIKTYIADAQGKYSFHDLDKDVSYELHAEWKGKTSPTRTASSFDARTDITLDLKIPVS